MNYDARNHELTTINQYQHCCDTPTGQELRHYADPTRTAEVYYQAIGRTRGYLKRVLWTVSCENYGYLWHVSQN